MISSQMFYQYPICMEKVEPFSTANFLQQKHFIVCLTTVSFFWIRPFLCVPFLDRLHILQQFQDHSNIEQKIRDFSSILFLHTCGAALVINIPHQGSTMLKTDEPILMHHNHPKFIVYLILGVVHPMSFDKCVMICFHHYSFIQNSFTH